jgi:hypothetical protein
MPFLPRLALPQRDRDDLGGADVLAQAAADAVLLAGRGIEGQRERAARHAPGSVRFFAGSGRVRGAEAFRSVVPIASSVPKTIGRAGTLPPDDQEAARDVHERHGQEDTS